MSRESQESRMLWCFIENDTTAFPVTTPIGAMIYDLKELIKEEGINATEHPIFAKDLTLWKVRYL
jgi:Crinkler effector protein N-terminal domain